VNRLNIVTLCTGNVARSVMLGYMLTTISETKGEEWRIRTAGTHVTEGSAMSGRTRDALRHIKELGNHRYGAHRSHQLNADDVEWADIILAAEADNVKFVRTNFESHSPKAVQLAQFVRFAPPEDVLDQQLRAAYSDELSKELDVDDPAGGDQATYDACARKLWVLAQAFALIVEGRTV
jgi:protein-tyrosine-phosphatase